MVWQERDYHPQGLKEVQQFERIPVAYYLSGYHVTDDPQRIITTLERGDPLDKGEDDRAHDLQTGGLYFSEAPQIWMSRSTRKWNFAKDLTPEQQEQIAAAVMQERRFLQEGYLTTSEIDRAGRYMERYRETGSLVYLQFIAEQPYNLETWKNSFLEQLGIHNPHIPEPIPVKAEGTFSDLSRVQITKDLIARLKAAGYDGACVTSSIAYLPQSVVWTNRAIVQCGTYHRPAEQPANSPFSS